MALQTINNVNIVGISSAVPANYRTIEDEYEFIESVRANRISELTGINKRHVTLTNQCASDIAYASAEKLTNELGWSPLSIDCLVHVTQTPDYIVPNTASVLHKRLGMSKHAVVFDVNLGCSGYVYGLWIVSNFLQQGKLKRALLLVADSLSKVITSDDPTLKMLFGDGASSTALEYADGASCMKFNFGSDGSGFDSLIIPSGGFRKLENNVDIDKKLIDKFLKYQSGSLYMDGSEIMNFTLREVPRMIDELMNYADIKQSDVDYCIMHQANLMLLNHLAKKMNIPESKMLLSINDFGNTSSASIPITISHKVNAFRGKTMLSLILSGFGVGFSWASVFLRINKLIIPEIIYVKG